MSSEKAYLCGRYTDLSITEAFNILSKTDVNTNFIMSLPPVQPKGGEVFLYSPSSSEIGQKLDFRFDQYRWISKGSNFHANRANPPTVLKRYYYLKDPKGKKKDSLNGFRKHVYCLRECKDAKPLYILHYLGDETLSIPSCHGNCKTAVNTKPFTATMKSAIQEMRDSVQLEKGPLKTYKKLQSTHSLIGSDKHMAVDRPRNLKQVQNISYQERKKKSICNDAFFCLVELTVHLEGYITHVAIIPDLVISFGHPDIIKEAHELISISNKDATLPQLLSYDTTFNIGDFYLSTFVIRNVKLCNDPIFPVAFLLHERKFKSYHQDFLCKLLKRLDGHKIKSVPIVTDREWGIVKPLNMHFAKMPHIFCTNHILSDVEIWIKKHGGKRDDIKVLKDHVSQLLNADSPDYYEKSYKDFSIQWSEAFKSYFDCHLKDCIAKHSAKFITSKYAAFQNDIKATNNISESFNKVIKDELDWKEVPVDGIILAMFYMQCYYLYEFKRAYCGLGNYKVKNQFSALIKSATEFTFPDFFPLESIIDKIKSTGPIPVKGIEKKKNYRMSQISLARHCIETGGVSLCPQSATFVIRNVSGSKYEAVRLLPEPSICSCPSTGKCYHIIAAQMAIGYQETADKHTYSLSRLWKNRKCGKRKKSGRKKARIDDYDYECTPAPDSILSSSLDRSISVLERSQTEDKTSLELEELYMTLPKHSTPKKSKEKSAETSPWNIEALRCERQLLSSTEQYILSTLDPGEWLCGEVIEEALMNFICQRHLNEQILACPVYIYQSAVRGQADLFYSHLERNSALNMDLILMPFNTDAWGSGQHWCLGVISFRTREVIIVDSMIQKERVKDHGQIILSIAAASHQLAHALFIQEEWKVYLCEDAIQQTNTFDCGVYTLLNAYSIISGEEYAEVQSERVRRWLESNVLQHKHCACKKKRLRLSKQPYRKMHNELLKMKTSVVVEEKPLTEYLRSLVNKDSSRWSTCAENGCPGNYSPDDCMILCCHCRNWYHVCCLPSIAKKLPTYYKCAQCSAASK